MAWPAPSGWCNKGDDMLLSRILLCGLLAVALAAQSLEEKRRIEEKAMAEKRAAEMMTVISSGFAGSNRLVTGKPFAAEGVTDTLQVLIDGNRIERQNVIKQYRDRNGRTRREQILGTLGPANPLTPREIVILSDPSSNTEYALDTAAKTARKIAGLGAAMPRSNAPDAGEARREDLGKKIIEGLECTGSRTTLTIPAGRIGNLRPIVAITEQWYAPAIEAIVQSTTRDPRYGETTYRLRNIRLGDQPAQLFDPPADYRMEADGKF
jgi:hypothetical protein